MQTFAEVQAASSAAYRTLGDLEWEVESTTVTHSSADWCRWDLLHGIAKVPKRSEKFLPQRDSNH